jgi:hypothetical protein
MPSSNNDEFVADPTVARELGISLMTVWRHDHSPEMAELGWPARVTIRKRNYRSRHQLEKFKQAMLRRAMAQRKKFVAEAT